MNPHGRNVLKLVRFYTSLDKGLYCGHIGKEYTTEVVTTAKKLPLDGFEDIEDSLGEAQSQQDNDKETRSRRQSQEGS